MEEDDSHQLVRQDILLRIRIRNAIDFNSHESKRNSFHSQKDRLGLDGGSSANLGAALAYYTVFSLAPLLIIAIAIAGLVLGQEAAHGQIFDQLRGLLGEESGKAMQAMVQSANAKPATGVVATLIGVVTLLFGASGVFGQLQTSLNAIWGVQPKPGRGVLGHSAGSDPLLWLYSGNWLSAPGFPYSHRRHRSCGKVVRRHVSRNGDACPPS